LGSGTSTWRSRTFRGRAMSGAGGGNVSVGLFHAGQAGVSNQMLLQVGIDWALSTQPGKGAFSFSTQMNFRKFQFSFLCWRGVPDLDLHQVGARVASGTCLCIHAAGGDDLGLGVFAERAEQGDEVVIGDVLLFARKDAGDVAAREAGKPPDVGLLEIVL